MSYFIFLSLPQSSEVMLLFRFRLFIFVSQICYNPFCRHMHTELGLRSEFRKVISLPSQPRSRYACVDLWNGVVAQAQCDDKWVLMHMIDCKCCLWAASIGVAVKIFPSITWFNTSQPLLWHFQSITSLLPASYRNFSFEISLSLPTCSL